MVDTPSPGSSPLLTSRICWEGKRRKEREERGKEEKRRDIHQAKRCSLLSNAGLLKELGSGDNEEMVVISAPGAGYRNTPLQYPPASSPLPPLNLPNWPRAPAEAGGSWLL